VKPPGRERAPAVVAIFGPTASGKSELAETVADRLGTEVVSADAMQVYRDLPILTNQPARPTRLVGIRDLSETMSVGEYEVLAHTAIDELVGTRGRAVVAGGTGLYLRAALSHLDLPPAPPAGLRDELARTVDELGPAGAHALLAERDPAAAVAVHPNDRRRVVRALELAAIGRSLRPAEERLWSNDMRLPTMLVGLEIGMDELERRIRRRTLLMVDRGAVDEALGAVPASVTAGHVIGLEEFRTLPVAQAVEAVVLRTRRYAAYQRKWLRRLPLDLRLDATRPVERLADEVEAALADTPGHGRESD
jgi:tRNA dimethylallyltransferase